MGFGPTFPKLRVIILSRLEEEEYLWEALKRGAAGFTGAAPSGLDFALPPAELIAALALDFAPLVMAAGISVEMESATWRKVSHEFVEEKASTGCLTDDYSFGSHLHHC